MSELRFYYKKKDETEWYALKTPEYDNNEDYVKLTEEEWQEHLRQIEKVVISEVEGE